MTRYVALLRGINVGRNKRIAMADLRALLSRLGYQDVVTLLQSGNVVFTAKDTKPDHVVRAIEKALDDDLGMSVRCLVRTGPEMRAVVEGNPLAEVATDPSKFLVTFLSSPIADGPDPAQFAPEQFRIVGREIYMWFPDGIRDAKLGRFNWDKNFQVVASGRNWNTVQKLATLANP